MAERLSYLVSKRLLSRTIGSAVISAVAPGACVELNRDFVVTGRSLSSANQTDTVAAAAAAPDSAGSAEKERHKAIEVEQKQLLAEASALTRALYRNCIRSVRLIRHGNEHDECEFQNREKKMQETPAERDPRLSMLTMLPPVDREDELRSRAEYYMQYAHENFIQESDCFAKDKDLDVRQIDRFVHFLRAGETQRKWLLADMKFPDPYQNAFDDERVKQFEQRASAVAHQIKEMKLGATDPRLRAILMGAGASVVEDEHDDFFDEEDEVTSTLPTWHKNPRSG